MSRKPTNTKELTKKMSAMTLDVLIPNYVADMKLRRLSPLTVVHKERTLKRMVRALGPKGEHVRLADLTGERVRSYIGGLQGQQHRYEHHPIKKMVVGELAPASVANEVQVLKAFGSWLKREGFTNPFGVLRMPSVPKTMITVLTDAEVGKLLEAVNPATPTGARSYAMLLLLLDSGIRIGELVTAKMEDLDLEHRRLKVMGKGAKERFAPFGVKTAKALMRYIQLHRAVAARPGAETVFLALDGVPLTTNGARHIIDRVGDRAGIERIHPHLFRHTFAVNYILNGGDIITLKAILGHESLEMVNRYLHFSSAQMGTRYDTFSPMDKMDVGVLRRFGNKRRPKGEAAE